MMIDVTRYLLHWALRLLSLPILAFGAFLVFLESPPELDPDHRPGDPGKDGNDGAPHGEFEDTRPGVFPSR